MRVLLVNTRHFNGGGDSTYTFNLAALLAHHGHEIAFFAMQDQRNLPDPNADLFVSPIDFRELNRNKTLTNGLKVLTRTIYSSEARRKFAMLLDRFSPDVIHLQNFFNHITPSILFQVRQHKPAVVWTLHDYGLVCPNSHFLIDRTGRICEACRGGRFYHAIFKRCKKDSIFASGMAAFEAYCTRWMRVLNQVDAFLAPSRFLKSKLVENGFAEIQVHHLPLFVRQEHFREGDEDEGYFLFLGKLEAVKGIHILQRAAELAPGVTLKIAGSVEPSFASRLGKVLPSNAEYVGLKYGKDLEALTRGARAIVLPSIWYENQPFSILEAFAAGKPVIASDLGGMSELVADRERGLLVKPGDPGALADALQWAVTNQTRMKVMGENARQYALENHSPEIHYQSLMDIYSQVCSGNVG